MIRRKLAQFEQLPPLILLAVVALVRQRQANAGLIGQLPQCFGETQPLVLHQERKHITALAAAETVIHLPVPTHDERGGLLVCERRQRLEPAPSRGFQAQTRTNDLDYVDGGEHLGNGITGILQQNSALAS